MFCTLHFKLKFHQFPHFKWIFANHNNCSLHQNLSNHYSTWSCLDLANGIFEEEKLLVQLCMTWWNFICKQLECKPHVQTFPKLFQLNYASECIWHWIWAFWMIMQAHAMNIQFHAHGFDHTCLASPSINKSLTPFKFHPWINLKCCRNQNRAIPKGTISIFFNFSNLKFN